MSCSIASSAVVSSRNVECRVRFTVCKGIVYVQGGLEYQHIKEIGSGKERITGLKSRNSR